MVFWGSMIMKPNIKIVDIHPRSTGSKTLCLSDVVTNIIATIELVKNKKMIDVKLYVKMHEHSAATTAWLFKIYV